MDLGVRELTSDGIGSGAKPKRPRCQSATKRRPPKGADRAPRGESYSRGGGRAARLHRPGAGEAP